MRRWPLALVFIAVLCAHARNTNQKPMIPEKPSPPIPLAVPTKPELVPNAGKSPVELEASTNGSHSNSTANTTKAEEKRPVGKLLLIAVISAPNHFKARTAIRDVWRMYQESHLVELTDFAWMDLRFFVGDTHPNDTVLAYDLEQEGTVNPDLVRLPGLTEHYFNLTRKTLAVLSWARDHSYQHLFKVDDDSFLRVDNLVKFIKAEKSLSRIYAGSFVADNPVIGNPESKWYNKDLYPFDTYPEYAGGPGYFLGRDVMDHILTQQPPRVLYRVEDAAVGIWTQNMAGLDRVNLVALTYSFDCWNGDDIIYVNPVEWAEMTDLMTGLLRGDMCDGGAFVLRQCRSAPCLCHPAPEDCEMDAGRLGKNWVDFSNERYEDVVARLVQQQWKVRTARKATYLEK